MNKKLLWILVLLLIPIAIADPSFIFSKNSSPDISISCVDENNNLCGAGTDCLITIIGPNSSVIINNGTMSNNINYYNYSLNKNQTNELGEYSAFVYCDGTTTSYTKFTYEITRSGKTLEIPESLLYILLTFAIFCIFVISLYFTIAVPYANKRDDNGDTVRITKTKYIKMGLVGITYSLFLWFLNMLIGISNNFINLEMYYGFVSGIFLALLRLSLPLLILIIVWSLFEIIRDINKQKLINIFKKA